MRTTVDLPPRVHQRVREIADARGVSMSAVIADLAVRGLAGLGEPVRLGTDPRTGFPLLEVGRPITQAEVEAFLDEDE